MFKIPLEEIKRRLLASGTITELELQKRVKEKINDLSGLISEEGAAHIIANELGVSLVSAETSILKIKEVYAGMRNINTLGKVVKKFEVREFAKGESKGKVCSLILGDETGTVRVVFWNDQVDLTRTMMEDDVVQIKNAYARENNNDREIHLGKEGQALINPPGQEVQIVRRGSNFERKTIQKLQQNEENIEIVGTVVQVFDPRFFAICADCNKKVMETEGAFRCAEHGVVQPSYSCVLNLMLDDGTGTIRGVFWKNQALHLLGKEEATILKYKENLSLFEDTKTELLGELFKLKGRVKKNDYFDRLEFNVQLVEKANPEEEITRLEK